MDRVELLSPAGDYECFLAAVSAGADAVYLGLDRFSARASAANLTSAELLKTLDIAHLYGVKVYLTVNTLFRDDELSDLYDMLYEPYIRGLDAVIVQDIGAMNMISSYFPDLPIHASTQAAITSSEGALFLKDLGITRVVPARELSLAEISRLKEETGLEMECFIHGSMCYSYSGKCLLSSFIGGRSGNRGRCAQPCRLCYDDEYLLSLSDLCCVQMIPDLINAGISSFKIEGRAKSCAYVHNVTSIYRKYIDEYYASKNFKVDKADFDSLVKKYSRGVTGCGYYRSHNDKKMITIESPSYVTNEEDKAVDIKLSPIPIRLTVNIKKEEKVSVKLCTSDINITYVSDVYPDTAQKAPLTEDTVKKQFNKLGDTHFTAEDISVICDDGLFIANGILNSIRRAAINELNECILKPFLRTEPNDFNPYRFKGNKDEDLPKTLPRIRAQILSVDQINAVLDTDADDLIVPMYVYDDITKDMRKRLSGRKIYLSLPFVVRDEGKVNDPLSVKKIIDKAASDQDVAGLYVSNLESAKLIWDSSYRGEVMGDIHLYSYNRYSASYYKDHGIDNTTVPVELNLKQLKNRGIRGEELIVYGRLPMMISANCIVNTKNGCRFDAKGHCEYITDRKNMKMFSFSNCAECTSVLYNSVKLCLTDDKDLFNAVRPSSIRFIFTDEDPGMIRRVINDYAAKRDDKGITDGPIIADLTRGHINRGVD